ncbi:MAG: SDR family oxidoreductase [Pararhodobacter sp.]|nr:SDR family oxidoreductase [Pararhodobacter sp.]
MTEGNRRLEGKVALLTRAGSGISETGGTAISIVADVADEAAVNVAVDKIIAFFGRPDVAFNNAGALGSASPVAQMETSDFDAIIVTSLRGVRLMARAEIRAILASKTKGSIINTSSFVARAAGAGTSAYAANKAGVDAMTRALALEVGGAGIRVNNVAPGVIETPMFDGSGVPEEFRQALANHAALKRLERPVDLAEAVAWLASDQAAFVTGQSILIDGGITIPGLR